MDAREKKSALRREILAQRNRLKPEEKEKMDRQILKRLLDWEPLWTGRPVFLYLSFGSEVNTWPLLEELFRRKIPVAGSPGGGEGDGFLPDPWKRWSFRAGI